MFEWANMRLCCVPNVFFGWGSGRNLRSLAEVFGVFEWADLRRYCVPNVLFWMGKRAKFFRSTAEVFSIFEWAGLRRHCVFLNGHI